MKLHLKPGKEVEPFVRQPVKCVAQNLPCRERHRLAAVEIDVAQQPAGIGRPRQDLERVRVGDHDEIASALHLLHGKAAAGGEYRIDRLVRGILGQQRRRHGHAALHQRRRIGGDDRLAAQHAVLIGERKPHQFQLIFLDRLLDCLGATRLIRRSTGCGVQRRSRAGVFVGGIRRRHSAAPRSGEPSARPGMTILSMRILPSFWSLAGFDRYAANSPANPGRADAIDARRAR